jgi:membrane protease YdiL (CAAX protease family)
VQTAAHPDKAMIRWVVWGAMLVASSVPELLCRSQSVVSLWLPLVQVAVLLIGATVLAFSPTTRVLCGFVLALVALHLGWSVFTPAVAFSDSVSHWATHLSWGARFFVGRLLPVGGAILMLITLFRSGLTRRDLFLCRGDLNAPAQPEAILWFRRPIPWTRFGYQLLIIFGIALPLFLFFSVGPDLTKAWRIWRYLPWGLATAALNAANEEFQFRSVLLARLKDLLSDREALLLTAVLFGLCHYYGQPSGPIGVIMAGVAGWIWGKSMLETRGFTWAFSIHFVQDVVIFCFLAMSVNGGSA